MVAVLENVLRFGDPRSNRTATLRVADGSPTRGPPGDVESGFRGD